MAVFNLSSTSLQIICFLNFSFTLIGMDVIQMVIQIIQDAGYMMQYRSELCLSISMFYNLNNFSQRKQVLSAFQYFAYPNQAICLYKFFKYPAGQSLKVSIDWCICFSLYRKFLGQEIRNTGEHSKPISSRKNYFNYEKSIQTDRVHFYSVSYSRPLVLFIWPFESRPYLLM